MSSYSRRPNVKAIDRALVDAAASGTVLIGSLIFNSVRALARAAADNFEIMPNHSDVLLPSAAIRARVHQRPLQIPSGLSKLERDRLEALSNLARQPLRIANATAISAHVDKVFSSANLAQLTSSVRCLREAAIEQNDSLFAAGVA